MSGDLLSLTAEMSPYVAAAAAAYGGAVLARARDEAVDATVGLGRRLLQRVFGVRREGEPLPGPVAELAASPGDEDALAVVRLAVRKALAADPVLEAELRSMLATAPGVVMHVHAERDGISSAGDQIITIHNHGEGSVRPQDPESPRRRTRGNVPTRNPGFRGREGHLAAVREALLSGDRAVVQALHGMGGVGKTQLAIEYAHRFAADYDLVWWIAAEQPEVIGAQFAAMAAALEWPPPQGGLAELRQMVRSRLWERERWLLVFDNAEDPRDVADWLPGGSGHVLITSRSSRWAEIAVPVEIDVLTRAESVALLQSRVPFLMEEDAFSVADSLGYLPLALAQAAEYMADTGMPAGDYLDLLTAYAAEILDHGRLVTYAGSLAAVIRAALVRLKNDDPVAAEFAMLCAFLAPEPVPAQWLATAGPVGGSEPQAADPRRWRPAVARIRQAALARLSQDALQMHRLTQAVLCAIVQPAEAAAVRSQAAAMLITCHPGSPQDPRSWPGWAMMVPHVLALDPVDSTSGDLRNLACDAAWYLGKRGDAQASHDLASRLYAGWRDRLGPDDHDTLHAAYNLAFALSRLEKYQEARDLDEDTLARRRRVLGEDHVDTLRSANACAVRLVSIGDFRAARDLEEDTLARCRRVLGDDHFLTLGAADNLALSMNLLGEPAAVRELTEDTLARRRRVLGEDHPDTLLSALRLARILRKLGERHAARDLDQDTFTRHRRVYGDDHPDTLDLASYLAWERSEELGDHQAARELGEDVLARYRRVRGADHPGSLESGSELAGFLRALDDYQAAPEPDEDALARRRTVLGASHPDTLHSADNLAEDVRGPGKLDNPT